MPWRLLCMDDHFDRTKANMIRCEECNQNFFFDYLRHPRYFVAHFKSCHLKNLLYRFNGYTDAQNQKTRFGPRRKRDAHAWFGQLKSTEKRMISMQDNKWSGILEHTCWICRLCNDKKCEPTHVFEVSDYGRVQAFLHLRQCHDSVYHAFLQSLPTVGHTPQENVPLNGDVTEGMGHVYLKDGDVRDVELGRTVSTIVSLGHCHHTSHVMTTTTASTVSSTNADVIVGHGTENLNVPENESRDTHATASVNSDVSRSLEAERSRLRRLHAPLEARQREALRSKKRRERMTPAQRQSEYARRQKKRVAKERNNGGLEEYKRKEVLRSRERRKNATEEQRNKEAMRSRRRRRNATEAQRERERERCRVRYIRKRETDTVSEVHNDMEATAEAPLEPL